MTELLAADNVSVSFGTGQWPHVYRAPVVHALEEVCFHISEGETLAIVGESGSGKTTLGRIVAGLLEPTSGSIRFRGSLLGSRRPMSVRRNIQMIFQDPSSSLNPRMRVREIITEPLRIQQVGTRADWHTRAAELIKQVGLPEDALQRHSHELSGGQRQRIAIARALASRPALIVADEPLSSLDAAGQSQILNLLRDFQERQHLSYLFISHDLGAVYHLADRVAVLYLGRLAEVAPIDALFRQPAHPYTRALLSAIPHIGSRTSLGVSLQGEASAPQTSRGCCLFHSRCPLASDICRERQPRLEPTTVPNHLAACHFKE